MDLNTNTRIRWEVIKNFPQLLNLAGKTVLDIGAGLGFFSMNFSLSGADVLAVDVDKASLEFLASNYRVNTLELDIEKESLPETLFDLVLIGEVLEHIKNPSAMLQKIYQSIKPGGYIIVTTPALEGMFIYSKGKRLCHDHGAEKHERDGFSYLEISNAIESSGFDILRHHYCVDIFAEIFMQMTKLVYSLKNRKYSGQSDILDQRSSLSYKVLELLYPIIFSFLKFEYRLCRLLKMKGHCHVILARR